MAKYSKGAGEKVEEVMHEMKGGNLKTGTGKKVTSRKQAIAIALLEAREEGEKVPKKTVAKKSAWKKQTKKTAAKKAAPKKAVAK
jgi:topoisomerase IA-like protein